MYKTPPRPGSDPNLASKSNWNEEENISQRTHKRKFQCECSNDFDSKFLTFKNEFLQLMSQWNSNQEKKLEDIHKSMSEITSKMSEIQQKNREIEKSIEFLAAQYEETNNKVSTLDLKSTEYDQRISKLEASLENLQRRNCLNLLEIRNIPISPQESSNYPMQIVSKIMKTVSAGIPDSEVQEARRLPSKTEARSILVTLNSTTSKMKILKAVKDYNIQNKGQKLSTATIGLTSSSQPIYVAEYLTPNARRLYYLGRELQKEGIVKYCWTANGRILLRKDDGAKIITVNDEQQIHQLKEKISK